MSESIYFTIGLIIGLVIWFLICVICVVTVGNEDDSKYFEEIYQDLVNKENY